MSISISISSYCILLSRLAAVASVALLPAVHATTFTPGFESLRVYACSGTNPRPPWNHSCNEFVQAYPALSQHVQLSGEKTAESSLTGVNAFSTFAYSRGLYDPSSRTLAARLAVIGSSPGGPEQIGSLFANPHSEVQLKFADSIFLASDEIAPSDIVALRFRVPLVKGDITGKTGGYEYRFDYTVDFNDKNAYSYHAVGNNASSSLSVTQGSSFDILNHGEALNISITLDASATAYGSNYRSPDPPVSITSAITLDFGNTIYWGGIESVYNVTRDRRVDQWTLHSLFAGVQWDLASPVPEPPASPVPEPPIAWLFGLGAAFVVAARPANRKRSEV